MADHAIELRKNSHLDLCANSEVEHGRKSPLFEDVELVHDAIPELDLDAIDTSIEIFGRTLRAPLLVTGMTGGTTEAGEVNRTLAGLAEEAGIGFGLGSQRAMLRRPELARTYSVRDVAPSIPILANLGLTQAVQTPTSAVAELVEAVDADALCVHLNAAQELVQREGDRSFRDGLAAIERLVGELGKPVVVKETGCGISRSVADRLQAIGVRYVDVSGAGGTSWVRVEQLRGDARSDRLGELFRDWGIPTAACLLQLRDSGMVRIASGGVRDALDVAKALALGASLVGFALPVFRAYRRGGVDAARAFVDETIEGLRVSMLLTGAADIEAMRRRPFVVGQRLRAWVDPETSQRGVR